MINEISSPSNNPQNNDGNPDGNDDQTPPPTPANQIVTPIPALTPTTMAFVMSTHATLTGAIVNLGGDVKGLRYSHDTSNGMINVPGPYHGHLTVNISWPQPGTTFTCFQALGADGQWRGSFDTDPQTCNQVPSQNFLTYPNVTCSPIIPLNLSNAWSDGGFAIGLGGKFGTSADTAAADSVSKLRIYENGVELSTPHALHADIRNLGLGRYSHWSNTGGTSEALRFSSTDNTDPRTNGRQYSYCISP